MFVLCMCTLENGDERDLFKLDDSLFVNANYIENLQRFVI